MGFNLLGFREFLFFHKKHCFNTIKPERLLRNELLLRKSYFYCQTTAFMNYGLARALLERLEAFERQHGEGDLVTFAAWLQEAVEDTGTVRLGPARMRLEDAIAAQMGQLWAHVKHYGKKVLKDGPLVSLNDYVFLLILAQWGDQRKTDLISLALMEVSPGIEVIRRLLRNGLVEDYDDPDDRRSKRVRISARGEEVLRSIDGPMNQMSTIVSGNLSRDEKRQLVRLLRKLVLHHEQIWREDQSSTLEEIASKYHREND